MPKTDRRQRRQHKARYGMQVTGRGVFTVLALLGRRARVSRTGPTARPLDRPSMVEPGIQPEATKGDA